MASSSNVTLSAPQFSGEEEDDGEEQEDDDDDDRIGRGTIYVHTNQGLKLIHDVLLVPELDQNMISVAQLMKNGYGVCFKADYCLILNSYGSEFVKVKMDGDSFYLKLDAMKNHGCDSEINGSMVGGERFGNENSKTLTFMEDYGMVADFFKMVEYDMDEECDVVSKEVHLYGSAYLHGDKQNVKNDELDVLSSTHFIDDDSIIATANMKINGSCLKIKLVADVYER